MPTYEYACTVCAERVEAVQSFTDPPLTECPACGERLRKVFSPVGVVFKGSGFYKNDSRGKKPSSAPAETKADAPAASGATSDSSSSGSGSSADSSSGSSSGSSESGSGSGSGGAAAKPAPSSTGRGTAAAS